MLLLSTNINDKKVKNNSLEKIKLKAHLHTLRRVELGNVNNFTKYLFAHLHVS